MSRLKPESEYEKTGAFHFFRWLSGSKDPYIGEVEMKPQKRAETSVDTILDRMDEQQMIRSRIVSDRKSTRLNSSHHL